MPDTHQQLSSLPLSDGRKWRDVVDTPAVLVDLDVVERNIRACQDQCSALGLKLRPHIKTHKIPKLALAQLAAGAIGITAQKISEAEVMVDAGIDNVLISYNIVGSRKLERLKMLASRCKLTVVADSKEVVDGLAETFTETDNPLNVLIECDTGMHRCGVATPEDALDLARQISQARGLNFAGLMTYPAVGGFQEANEWFETAVALLKANGFAVTVVSSGRTPDLYRLAPSPVMTEYRPGSYIYNDRSVLNAGNCTLADCALTVATTVVGSYEGGRTVVDAGSKILTSDLFGMQHYGIVFGDADSVVTGVNEEHGIIRWASSQSPSVGDVLRILPNHACVVSNMVDKVHFIRGENYVGEEIVSARGTIL